MHALELLLELHISRDAETSHAVTTSNFIAWLGQCVQKFNFHFGSYN